VLGNYAVYEDMWDMVYGLDLGVSLSKWRATGVEGWVFLVYREFVWESDLYGLLLVSQALTIVRF
jgi:hypothetical protein